MADGLDDPVLGLDHTLVHAARTVSSMNYLIRNSVIACPHCRLAKREEMPVDACQFFYVCTGCGARLRPNEGDCCVFCSFGSVPCPPKQAGRSGAH